MERPLIDKEHCKGRGYPFLELRSKKKGICRSIDWEKISKSTGIFEDKE